MNLRLAWPLAFGLNVCLGLCLVLGPPAAQAAPDQDPNEHKNSGPVIILPPPVEMVDDNSVSHPPALLLPGREYKSGSGWWALSCDRGCRLTAASLVITPQMHPQYDGPMVPGQLMRWSPVPPPHTLMMFKPFRAPADQLKLAPGPVKTVYPTDGTPLPRPRSEGTLECQIALPDGPVARLVPVQVLPGKKAKVDPFNGEPLPLVLELRIGDARQVLGNFDFGIEGPGVLTQGSYVLWAGDLDGDGRLDLLVKTDYAGDGFALFLSSLAKPGELVGEAGRFDYFPIESPGC